MSKSPKHLASMSDFGPDLFGSICYHAARNVIKDKYPDLTEEVTGMIVQFWLERDLSRLEVERLKTEIRQLKRSQPVKEN